MKKKEAKEWEKIFSLLFSIWKKIKNLPARINRKGDKK